MEEDDCYAVEESRQNEAYIRLYMIDYENDDFDCTYGYLDKLDELFPDYKKYTVLFLRGDAYIQEEKYDKALE